MNFYSQVININIKTLHYYLLNTGRRIKTNEKLTLIKRRLLTRKRKRIKVTMSRKIVYRNIVSSSYNFVPYVLRRNSSVTDGTELISTADKIYVGRFHAIMENKEIGRLKISTAQ